MRAEDHIPSAIEVFTQAFARIRSRTYPCVVTKIKDFHVMHDEPYRLKARASELVTQNRFPEEHLEVGNSMECPRWYSCLVTPPDSENETLTHFKSAGFKRRAIEPLFMIDPRDAYLIHSHRVQRIQDPELVELCRIANKGRRQLLPHEVEPDDSTTRLYAALLEGKVYGWGSSIKVQNLGHWVSDLYVIPEARRQGLGLAIMSAILTDDARLGSPMSVLLASNAGAHLYRKMRYQSPANLHILRPPGYIAKPRELCL